MNEFSSPKCCLYLLCAKMFPSSVAHHQFLYPSEAVQSVEEMNENRKELDFGFDF